MMAASVVTVTGVKATRHHVAGGVLEYTGRVYSPGVVPIRHNLNEWLSEDGIAQKPLVGGLILVPMKATRQRLVNEVVLTNFGLGRWTELVSMAA